VLEVPGAGWKRGPSMAVEDEIVVQVGRLRARLDPESLRVSRVESAAAAITLHAVRELNDDGVSEERR
jgi:hypothetical protein